MSFILDALKKSETERQGQSGLGVADVPVASESPRAPAWLWWLIALLGINLLVLLAVLLRPGPVVTDDAGARDTERPGLTTPAADAGADRVRPVPGPDPGTPSNPAAGVSAAIDSAPPSAALATPAARVTREPDPQAPAPETQPDGRLTDPDTTIVPATDTGPGAAGPGDRFPAAAATPAPRDEASEALTLPTLDELRVRDGYTVSDLHVDIHVYSNQPAGRFVYINSAKYREGETLTEGPRVVSIVEQGVVLEHRGTRFLLPRE